MKHAAPVSRFTTRLSLPVLLLLAASLGVLPADRADGAPKSSPKMTVQAAAPKSAKTTPAKAVAAPLATPAVEPAPLVSPLDLLKAPETYLNKPVRFEGTFNSFSSLGLDYPKALRSSKDYVGVLIRRPDVTHHEIPLSELKMFYPREKSEQVLNLEVGDKIRVQGTVFNTSLNEPWLDIQQLEILEKMKKEPKPEECVNNAC